MTAKKDPLSRRVQTLRKALKARNPEDLARFTGTTFENPPHKEGHFLFPYWDQRIMLPCSDYVARNQSTDRVLSIVDQAMIAYYFHDSKDSGTAGGWISFSELPDGQFYASAFKGYTSRKILQTFKTEYKSFKGAARDIGGKPVSFASQAYRIHVFPRVDALLACWRGDEEISPSYQILFQDTVIYHLPTDACAILGSMITSKLIKARKNLQPVESGEGQNRTQGHNHENSY